MCGPRLPPTRAVQTHILRRLTLLVLNSRQLERVGRELSVVFRIFVPMTEGLRRLFRWQSGTTTWISSFVSTFS